MQPIPDTIIGKNSMTIWRGPRKETMMIILVIMVVTQFLMTYYTTRINQHSTLIREPLFSVEVIKKDTQLAKVQGIDCKMFGHIPHTML